MHMHFSNNRNTRLNAKRYNSNSCYTFFNCISECLVSQWDSREKRCIVDYFIREFFIRKIENAYSGSALHSIDPATVLRNISVSSLLFYYLQCMTMIEL